MTFFYILLIFAKSKFIISSYIYVTTYSVARFPCLSMEIRELSARDYGYPVWYQILNPSLYSTYLWIKESKEESKTAKEDEDDVDDIDAAFDKVT